VAISLHPMRCLSAPQRNSARVSGWFSSREIVDCEHNSSSEGNRSSARLNIGSGPQRIGIVAVFITGGDHQHAKANDLGQPVHHPLRRTRVLQARGQAIGQSQPSFDLAQGQQSALRRQPAAVKTGDHRLAVNW
jgi:hypothetical protein